MLWGSPELAAKLDEANSRKDERDTELGIWPENWDIVTAFTAIFSQWRVVSIGLGGIYYVGLDYAGVSAGLDRMKLATSPELWSGIQTMEAAARAELNSRLAG